MFHLDLRTGVVVERPICPECMKAMRTALKDCSWICAECQIYEAYKQKDGTIKYCKGWKAPKGEGKWQK